MEVFTNLSLDLEPGGSVSQALDRYLTVSDPTLGHGPTMLSLIPPLGAAAGGWLLCVRVKPRRVLLCWFVGELSEVRLPVRRKYIWHADLLPDPT